MPIPELPCVFAVPRKAGREGAGKDKRVVARWSGWQEGVGASSVINQTLQGLWVAVSLTTDTFGMGGGLEANQTLPPWKYHWPHSEYIGLKSSYWKNFIVQLNPFTVNYSKFTKHKLFALLTLSSCPYACQAHVSLGFILAYLPFLLPFHFWYCFVYIPPIFTVHITITLNLLWYG